MKQQRICRFCSQKLEHEIVNLGMSPLANSYVSESQLYSKEVFFPLTLLFCEKCFLAQLEEFESPENIFGDYAYFSSYSESWLDHVRSYVDKMIANYSLTSTSRVIEIASNDGYLLQYFVKNNIPVLGIEPARNVAEAALKKGVETKVAFFGEELANSLFEEGIRADLLIGNNVVAHVPDLNDFIAGMKKILNATGIITLEFPHLLNLLQKNQFDTIYHEHFSYFSLSCLLQVCHSHGLQIFDVEKLQTHGGSLRVYIKHDNDKTKEVNRRVWELIDEEESFGIKNKETYVVFGENVKKVKRDLLSFLIEAKNEGKKIVGYGAPAKGNTLLNYCGIGTDFLEYTVDMNPYKQGKYLPGTHIPIKAPEEIKNTKPDYVLILPWNIKDEIIEQNADISDWGGKFIVAIPEVMVI